MKVYLFLNLILIIPLLINCYLNETIELKLFNSFNEDNTAWSKLLEDYTTSKTNRMSRMEGPYRYIPTSNLYIRRIGEAAPTEQNYQPDFHQQYSQHQQPHLRPMTLQQNTMQQRQESLGHQQNNVQQQQPMMGLPQPMTIQPRIETNRQNFLSSPLINHNQQFNGPSSGFHHSQQQQKPPLREVSETDLYLLGAIEKLVYRVDYLENRVRRTEQLIYYLMAGNNENRKEVAVDDPCPKNFTKIGETCYHISEHKLNWKSANQICKSMSSHLAEFESITENEEIVAYILNHPEYRSKDFWLGGLNPGLLWIWSNSAKPVNPNLNLANLTNSNNGTKGQSNSNETESQNKVINNTHEIKGNGRCLRLSYNSIKHTYHYFGQECTSRHNFLCKFEDRSTENQIKKIGKALNIF